MNYTTLNSSEVFLIVIGLLAEAGAFICYQRFKIKGKRLYGSGRIVDIEAARNWRALFSAALVIIPILVFLLQYGTE